MSGQVDKLLDQIKKKFGVRGDDVVSRLPARVGDLDELVDVVTKMVLELALSCGKEITRLTKKVTTLEADLAATRDKVDRLSHRLLKSPTDKKINPYDLGAVAKAGEAERKK